MFTLPLLCKLSIGFIHMSATPLNIVKKKNYLCCTKCRLCSEVGSEIAASTTSGPNETAPTSSQSSPTPILSILLEKNYGAYGSIYSRAG
jgi:hypothetical protein